MVEIGVLVATRNRPQFLRKLLFSLTDSSNQISQVVIVASGEDVSSVVEEFSHRFEIEYYLLDKPGQIRQKQFGFSQFRSDIEWILNLDDDLLLDPKALVIAETIISSDSVGLIGGIGFALPSQGKRPTNFFKNFLTRIFCLQGKPGKVLKSGHAVNYLDSDHQIRTDWLNGASLWKRNAVSHYEAEFLEARYSAYEDVIFSYEAGQSSILLFAPDCKLSFQEIQPNDIDSLLAFSSASYWRYYFVRKNRELSLTLLIWSQIGRSLDFLWRQRAFKRDFYVLSLQVLTILFDIAQTSMRKTDPLLFISSRLSR